MKYEIKVILETSEEEDDIISKFKNWVSPDKYPWFSKKYFDKTEFLNKIENKSEEREAKLNDGPAYHLHMLQLEMVRSVFFLFSILLLLIS